MSAVAISARQSDQQAMAGLLCNAGVLEALDGLLGAYGAAIDPADAEQIQRHARSAVLGALVYEARRHGWAPPRRRSRAA